MNTEINPTPPPTDTERLNFLVQHSGMSSSDCYGHEVYLIVTKAAVAKCDGTHLPAYHAAVRAAIDAAIKGDS